MPGPTNPAFPQFARLPPELRRQVWRHAVPTRVIAIRFKLDLQAWSEVEWLPVTDKFAQFGLLHSRPPAYPAVVAVNREARDETLPMYAPLDVDWQPVRKYTTNVPTSPKIFPNIRLAKDLDVLEWDISTLNAAGEDARLLFLGICSTVSHLSLVWTEPVIINPVQMMIAHLCLSMLDTRRCLQTLTMSVWGTGRRCRSFRVARRPEKVESEPTSSLTRYGAYLLDWAREPSRRFEQPAALQPLSGSWDYRPLKLTYLDPGEESVPLFDPNVSILEILSTEHLREDPGLRGRLKELADPKVFLRPALDLPSYFGDSLQCDLKIVLDHLLSPPIPGYRAVIPCHGFCMAS